MNATHALRTAETTTTTNPQARPAFGTVLAEQMSLATYANGAWSANSLVPVAPLAMHPAAHVLHYASTCFEGFKAYRWADGSINVWRMDRHIARMRQSARLLGMLEPDAAQLAAMVTAVIDRVRTDVPHPPGSLYLRPMLIGTNAGVGGATVPPTEGLLIVLASPVWDYFDTGPKSLRLFVEEQATRTASQMGMVKTGG